MRCDTCGARIHGICVACLYGLGDEAGRRDLVLRLGVGAAWDDDEYEEVQELAEQDALDEALADNLDTLEGYGFSGERPPHPPRARERAR